MAIKEQMPNEANTIYKLVCKMGRKTCFVTLIFIPILKLMIQIISIFS